MQFRIDAQKDENGEWVIETTTRFVLTCYQINDVVAFILCQISLATHE